MLHATMLANGPAHVINVTCEQYACCKGLDIHYLQRMEDESQKPGRLRIFVENCRDLPQLTGFGNTNPLLRLRVMKQTQKSECKRATTNPVFNTKFEFFLGNAEIDDEVVIIDAFSKALDSGEEMLLGSAVIPLSGLVRSIESLESRIEGSYPLAAPKADKMPNQKEDIATMKVDELHKLKKAIFTGQGTEEYEIRIVDAAMHRDGQHAATLAQSFGIGDDNIMVTVEGKKNRLIFKVRKRLNFFQTSKRHIIIDYANGLLRNTTVHGRTRKQFPFEQIKRLKRDLKNPSKLIVEFVEWDVRDSAGVVVAIGGQRNYTLTFISQEMRDLFEGCLLPVLTTSVRFDRGIVSFKVTKRLNALQIGSRTLILDLMARKMYNVDENAQARRPETAAKDAMIKSGVSLAHADVRKTFNFSDVNKIDDDKSSNPNEVTIRFFGTQQPYKVEFLTYEQKETFCKVLTAFMVSMTFALPPLFPHALRKLKLDSIQVTPATDARIHLKIAYSRPQVILVCLRTNQGFEEQEGNCFPSAAILCETFCDWLLLDASAKHAMCCMLRHHTTTGSIKSRLVMMWTQPTGKRQHGWFVELRTLSGHCIGF